MASGEYVLLPILQTGLSDHYKKAVLHYMFVQTSDLEFLPATGRMYNQ